MAQLLGPSFFALQVRDLEASRRFYTEQLGCTVSPAFSNADAYVFEGASIPFAIRKPLVDLDASSKLGWGVSLWFSCDNADALCASLASHGTPIITPPFDSPFGRTFIFADPDGYMHTAHQQR
ncbi:MAG: VOC family protein [Chloroflexaceae bacterium]|nr:VOC family protein [Chloroflexaceae bacterium]